MDTSLGNVSWCKWVGVVVETGRVVHSNSSYSVRPSCSYPEEWS